MPSAWCSDTVGSPWRSAAITRVFEDMDKVLVLRCVCPARSEEQPGVRRPSDLQHRSTKMTRAGRRSSRSATPRAASPGIWAHAFSLSKRERQAKQHEGNVVPHEGTEFHT